MSNNIAQNLQRLNTDKNNICDALITKGVIDAQDHGFDDFAEDILSIDNQYTLEDEGKVVSGGGLTSQTSTTVTTNTTIDTTLNNSVTVNVANSYSQADEGKVVNNGELTSQTSLNITENGEYNTTLNNSISVNVSNTPNPVSLSLHCVPTSNKYTFNMPHWKRMTWTGCTTPSGAWTDGDNIYCSDSNGYYVLIKGTNVWESKTWNGLNSYSKPTSGNIWTDGDNIYLSTKISSSTYYFHYILNKETSTWESKSWNGFTQFTGGGVWTDGDNVYYSSGTNQYILNKATSTWETKTWNYPSGKSVNISSYNVWTDGDNIYYTSYTGNSSTNCSFILNKNTSTWENKTFNNHDILYKNIPYIKASWSDGDNIYGYSTYGSNYGLFVLDKSNSTWYELGVNIVVDSYCGTVNSIWSDGINIYGTLAYLYNHSTPVMLVRESNSTITTNTTFPVLN